jgi:guanylate kinase
MQVETQLTTKKSQQAASPKQGLLFVLSAPSGTGKDTVIHALKEKGVPFHVVASVTTRLPRPGESEGNPYYFVSHTQFEEMIEHNELIEYAQVHGNWYGQPLQQIKDNLQHGYDVLLKIDVQGAATVRAKVPGAVFIFLVPGTTDELVERLTKRHTETEAERTRRLSDAQHELAQQDHYDYVIVNRQGQLADAVNNLHAVMQAEHCRTRPSYVDL